MSPISNSIIQVEKYFHNAVINQRARLRHYIQNLSDGFPFFVHRELSLFRFFTMKYLEDQMNADFSLLSVFFIHNLFKDIGLRGKNIVRLVKMVYFRFRFIDLFLEKNLQYWYKRTFVL